MRRRRGKGWELALDLLYGALACALSLTHGLFGVYPFALGLLAATPRRMLPCFLGAALGCYFMGRVGLLYLCVYGAVLLFRLLLSYPFKRRRLPSPALFSEEPALRVLVAALFLVSAVMQFVGLALIYNLDKKTLAKMNKDLGRDVEADDLLTYTTAEDNDNLA